MWRSTSAKLNLLIEALLPITEHALLQDGLWRFASICAGRGCSPADVTAACRVTHSPKFLPSWKKGGTSLGNFVLQHRTCFYSQCHLLEIYHRGRRRRRHAPGSFPNNLRRCTTRGEEGGRAILSL